MANKKDENIKETIQDEKKNTDGEKDMEMVVKSDLPEVRAGIIYKKMIEAMKLIGAIGKGQQNNEQHYEYRGIDDMYNELHDVFAEVGIFTTCEILHYEATQFTNNNGKILFRIIASFEYTFWAEDGSCVKSQILGEGNDFSDKAAYKTASGAQKYLFLQVFAIPTKDDKDPEKNTNTVTKPKQKVTGAKEVKEGRVFEPNGLSYKQLNMIEVQKKRTGMPDEVYRALLKEMGGVDTSKALKGVDASKLIDRMMKLPTRNVDPNTGEVFDDPGVDKWGN